MNGLHEVATFGRYGKTGVSSARTREMLLDTKRAIREGRSPAIEKQREKRRLKETKNFSQFAKKWFDNSSMAESTRYIVGQFMNAILNSVGEIGCCRKLHRMI